MKTANHTQKLLRLMTLLLAGLALSSPAHADLVVDGTGTMQGVAGSYQLIYDTDLNITWLDYSAPENTWQNQVNWASGLSVNVNGQDINGWRLPSTVDEPMIFSYNGSTSYGYNNPTTSEMSHLYYAELGNQGYGDIYGNAPVAGYGLIKKGPFLNLVWSHYWSDTKYATNLDYAWDFSTYYGGQTTNPKVIGHYALAVLPGQIQGASVPEPASMLLVGTSLAGLVGLKRRKK